MPAYPVGKFAPPQDTAHRKTAEHENGTVIALYLFRRIAHMGQAVGTAGTDAVRAAGQGEGAIVIQRTVAAAFGAVDIQLAAGHFQIAVDIHAVTGGGTYLFPSRNSVRKPIHYSTPLQALRAMGYGKEEMCIHGFRSMASTLLNEQGFDPDWIERLLSH